MATRPQKVKVGVFLIGCLLLMTAAILVISGYKHEDRLPYWIEFEESILGLSVDGLVVYGGVPVGNVSDIYVTREGKAHVEILITKGKVTLHEDVRATLGIYSLATGTMCVSLRGGDPKKPQLKYHGEIPSEKSTIEAFSSQIESSLDLVNDTLIDVKDVAEKVNRGLEGMEPGHLTRVINDADKVLIEAKDLLDETATTVNALSDDAEVGLQNFNTLTEDVRQLVKDTDDAVNAIKTKVEGLEISQTQDKLDQVLGDVSSLAQRLQESADTLDKATLVALHEADNVEYNLRTTLETLRESLDAVRELTVYLKQDPSALVRGKGKPKGGQ